MIRLEIHAKDVNELRKTLASLAALETGMIAAVAQPVDTADAAPEAEPEDDAAPAPAKEEKPKRRGRAKKEDKAEPEPQPEISANPEDRTDPEADAQDAADEAAEAQATAPVTLTHDDIRSALGEYVDKFGMPATQEDGPKIIGSIADGTKVSEIPDDQEKLAKVRDTILLAVQTGKRWGQ